MSDFPFPSEPSLPQRIVHLQGGLRAVDRLGEECSIEIDADLPLARIPTPKYADLYLALRQLKFTPVGAEFVHDEGYGLGISAPDWQYFAPQGGFQLMRERDEWANIRNAAFQDGNLAAADAASRCKSYIDLLSIRILHLSDAYRMTLREWRYSDRKPGNFFNNSHSRYIDAAVHAFVSDAGALRDLIAEIVWWFVLNESEDIRTLGSFLKKAKANPHPLAQTIIAAGKPGGWLHVLTTLRNNIMHVAPVGRSQTFHFCQVRNLVVSEHVSLPALHYAVLAEDGSIWREDGSDIDWKNEATIKAALERYRVFFATSVDALDYAWRTIGRLATLLAEARSATSFRAHRLEITDDDIVGDVKLSPGG